MPVHLDVVVQSGPAAPPLRHLYGGLSASQEGGLTLPHWRSRGSQLKTHFSDTNPRLRIGCNGCGQCLDEAWLKVPELGVTFSKLPKQRWPGNRCFTLQRVQPPSQPHIQIKRHGTIPELTYRCF